MLNKVSYSWLGLISAALITICSCSGNTQELSSYWDGHDFNSLKGFDNIREAEDKFEGYISLLSKASHEEAVESIEIFLDSAKLNEVAYMVWTGWFASAFRAMDSPYRSDVLFKEWFAIVEEDGLLVDDYMFNELKEIRELMDLNLVGDKPQDLNLTNYDGDEFKLSDITGEKTLLLFVDGNCPSCMESLKENLKEHGRSKVKLVAVLVNGSKYHVENINEKLPQEILAKWELVWCRDRELEMGKKYDLSQLSFRIMLNKEGEIVKSYY